MAVNNNGACATGASSATAAIATINPQFDNKVQLYPNPPKSNLNLAISNPAEVKRIVISKVTGKEVEVMENSAVLTLTSIGASLKPGAYVVEVRAAKWLNSFKVVTLK